MQNILIDNAKVMPEGQITLPKDIQNALGLKPGDKVTLIRQDDQVIMMNSALYALKMLQQTMQGESSDLQSVGDVDNLIMDMRAAEVQKSADKA